MKVLVYMLFVIAQISAFIDGSGMDSQTNDVEIDATGHFAERVYGYSSSDRTKLYEWVNGRWKGIPYVLPKDKVIMSLKFEDDRLKYRYSEIEEWRDYDLK